MKYLKPRNESIRHLLKGKNLDDVLKNNKFQPLEKLVNGCQYGILSLVKEVIENEIEMDDLNGFDFVIYSASIGNHIDVVEYLLKNTNLDPTIYNNASIEHAYIENNVELVELLLSDDRVRYSLPKFKVKDYERLIDTNKTNESIRHLLKPKPIDNLTDIQKFKISCKYDIETLFDETINKKISDDALVDGFYDAARIGNLNILNKLFNNKKFLKIIDKDFSDFVIYKFLGKSPHVIKLLISKPIILKHISNETLNYCIKYIEEELS